MGEIYAKTQHNADFCAVTKTSHDGFISSTNSVSGHSTSVQYVDSLSGSYNPGWKAQIRAGGDATTHLTGTKHTIDGSREYSYKRDGHYTIRTNFDSSKFYHEVGQADYSYPNPAWNDVPASLSTEVRNRAIRKFLDSAKSVRSSFEAGQDLGEIKQTIESFRHPLQSLKVLTTEYFETLKKAKRRYHGPGLHKVVSDSYLEYRFGWRPLALDIADAYSGLRDRLRMSETAPCHGYASGRAPISNFVGTSTYVDDNHVTQTTSTYVVYSYRIKGAIRLNLVDGKIPVLQALQLQTLNDFAVTAWDLLPYSFVVDYFTNVGDIINALTFPFSDLTYCCGTQRLSMVTKQTMNIVMIPPDAGAVYWDSQALNPANATLTTTLFDRSSLSSLDLVPKARISLPVSSRPWENIGALLSSNIKSLVPLRF